LSGRFGGKLFARSEVSVALTFKMKSAVISCIRRDVDEICALLGYYAASCGNFHTTPRNIPEERRSNEVFWVAVLNSNPEDQNLQGSIFLAPVGNPTTIPLSS
jgi:hypothetical protein